MQFRKINNNKIHCVISQEEMLEKGIELDDFLDHREKTEEFLREILAEARYELDLRDMGQYYSVQMSVMPEGDISLVISGEKQNSMEGALAEFGKRLQDFKHIVEEAKNAFDVGGEIIAKKIPKEERETEPTTETPIWAEMSSLEHSIVIAKELDGNPYVDSSLYKYKDAYYMQIIFALKQRQIAGTILKISEFAENVFTQNQGGELILEHGVPICVHNAIETLAKL